MIKIYERYIKKPVEEDLKSKMVFVGGPRQVGKTTFALTFLPDHSEKHPAYLNWDDVLVRSALLTGCTHFPCVNLTLTRQKMILRVY